MLLRRAAGRPVVPRELVFQQESLRELFRFATRRTARIPALAVALAEFRQTTSRQSMAREPVSGRPATPRVERQLPNHDLRRAAVRRPATFRSVARRAGPWGALVFSSARDVGVWPPVVLGARPVGSLVGDPPFSCLSVVLAARAVSVVSSDDASRASSWLTVF